MTDITVGELARRIGSLEVAINNLPERLEAKFVPREVFDIRGEQFEKDLEEVRAATAAAAVDRAEARRWRIATAVAGAGALFTTLSSLIIALTH